MSLKSWAPFLRKLGFSTHADRIGTSDVFLLRALPAPPAASTNAETEPATPRKRGRPRAFGNREEIVPTETVNGVSMTPQAIPLIRPEDISRLGRGETISLIQPCPWPVRGVAPVYTQTPFADGLDPNPYYRG